MPRGELAKVGGGVRWMPCRNVSGETIPPFSAARITGTDHVNGQLFFEIDKPNVHAAMPDCGMGYVFTSVRSMLDDGFGECTNLFPCFAAYNGLPTAANFVGITASAWTVSNARPGFRVVGAIANGLCMIIPGPMYLKGACDSTHAKGNSGTVTIATGTGGGTPSSVSVSAYNRYADCDSGDVVGVAWNGDEWDLIAKEC